MLEPSWVGRRVSVRRALEDGESSTDGRVQYRDAVGELVALDAVHATLQTRSGPVEVPLRLVAAARLATPSTRDELDLEATAARGWRPLDTASIGGWLLRAAGGFTGRANSVLPLGAPGLPLPDALAQARAWYAERDLPLVLAVPAEARRLLDAALSEDGWQADPMVHVYARSLTRVPAADGAVRLDPAPDDRWLAAYRDGAGTSPAGRAVLTNHDDVRFASINSPDGHLLAIGRGVNDDGWLGISAVHTDPGARRQGLASAITHALLAWGASRGARHSYLQVSSDNAAAIALYERLGYWHHHDYHYRREPNDRFGFAAADC